MYNDNNGNNISMANRVEQIYDFVLGAGCIVFSLLALSNLFIVTINKFVDYYSKQIDRIVMDESDSDSDSDSDSNSEYSESEYSDDDDDSTEIEYSEYSDEDEKSECRDDNDDDDDDDSDCHHHHHDDIELSPYIPPRRSQRLAENRAKCNSPLLVIRRLTFEQD